MEPPRRRWTVAPAETPESLAAHPDLPSLVVQLLAQRGVRTQEAIDEFLHPDYGTDLHDPFRFRDMRRAVDRCVRARDAGERVLVHGDYDADGVSGATVLLDALEGIGCVTDVFIPHRERDGYGFGLPGIAYAKEVGASLIITCDCGIANAETVRAAGAAGIDVIVTDHHVFPTDPATGAPMLPPAYAILHPKVPGETYPYADLTGGGVAFKLSQAIARADAASPAPRLSPGFEKWLLDAAAISTVSDYGPLIGENRTIVTYGLVVLQKTRRPGLKALYEIAGIHPERITPATIGFQIAPRINAAGRIDHANEALRLLRTGDPAEAKSLAVKLHATNAERQRLVERATAEALEQVGDGHDRNVLIVVGDDWLPGIVGLVATRLRDQFHRPAIALTRSGGRIVGSGRSIPEFHIVEALRSVADFLVTFGGHPQACGLTVKGDAELAAFRERIERYAADRLTPEHLVPTLVIDAELPLADATWELVEWLERIGPFGVGNPTPRFLARGLEVVDVRTMGTAQQHCRITVRAPSVPASQQLRHCEERSDEAISVSAESRLPRSPAGSLAMTTTAKMVCFRYHDICPTIRIGDVVDIVYEVDVNEWNGNREIQMKVVDVRNHQ